jgi:light-regulated signal transduction histidine kinase (bacteriophytochrome)
MTPQKVLLLLVEDNPVEAPVIKEMFLDLENGEIQIEHADWLSEKLWRLERERIEAALPLPDSQSLKTLAADRRQATNVPIVVLMGLDDRSLATEAVTRSAQDQLSKSLPEAETLRRAVRYAIERQRLVVESDDSRMEQLQQQKRLNGELALQNRELEEFAYVASHDLQEPLRKLVAFCGLLRRDLGDAERASRDLHFIEESATGMQKLVDDLLELSRTGRSDLKREIISLETCAGNAIDALQFAIERTGAEIERDALPEQWGDPRLLTQLYQNLIGNALKFSGERRPKIHLTSRYEGQQWILGVKDNGIGIQPQYAGQIFKAFQRLHARDEYEGSGIGLAICRKTVERHGGKIWVESVPGEGSHFLFFLG